MKKIILLMALIVTKGFFAQALPLTCYGGASYNSLTNTYTMSDASTCTGSLVATAAWDGTTVNFFKSFALDFDVRFTPIAGKVPADGICAVFGNYVNNPIPGSLNNGGGYLGYYDIVGTPTPNPDFQHSLAVEMDIFNNKKTISTSEPGPYFDHVMVANNANINYGYSAGPVQMDPANPIVSDGVWRHMRIEWDCATETLKVYCNGTLRTSDYINKWNFDDPFHVHWGFTAATGTGCATQEIKDPVITIGTDCTAGGAGSPCGTIDVTWSYVGSSGGNCIFNVNVTGTPTPGYTLSLPNAYSYTVSNPVYSSGWVPFSSTNITSVPGTPVFGFQTLTVCVKFKNTATGEDCIICITKRISCSNGTGGSIYKQGTTGITQTQGNDADKVQIYPNPAFDNVDVTSPEGMIGANYEVRDLTGRQLLSGTLNSKVQKVDVNNLSVGMYIFQVTQGGKLIQNIKFTKQ